MSTGQQECVVSHLGHIRLSVAELESPIACLEETRLHVNECSELQFSRGCRLAQRHSSILNATDALAGQKGARISFVRSHPALRTHVERGRFFNLASYLHAGPESIELFMVLSSYSSDTTYAGLG